MAVNNNNGIPVHKVPDLFAQPQGVHGRGVGLHNGLHLFLGTLVMAAQRIDPGQFVPAPERVAGLVCQLTQDHLGVTHDPDINRAVATDLFVRDIDLDHFDIFRKTRCLSKPQNEIEARPDNQHHIGLFPGPVARAQKAQGMVLGNNATPLWSGVKGDAGRFHELLEFLHRARPDDAGAANHQGSLGPFEQRHGLLDQGRITGHPRNLMGTLGKRDLFFFNHTVEHIARQIDIDRTRLAAGGYAKGFVDNFGDATRVLDPLGHFGDRFEHADLIHFLERAHTVLGHGARPTQSNNRHGIQIRIANTGNQIRDTGAGGGKAHPRLAQHPAIGVGRHGSPLLVTHIDRVKPNLNTFGGHIDHRPAGDIENGIYAFVFERLDDQ